MIFLELVSTRWMKMVVMLEQINYGGSGSSGVGACPLLGGSVSIGFGCRALGSWIWYLSTGIEGLVLDPLVGKVVSCWLWTQGVLRQPVCWWVDPCPCPVSGSLKGISYVTCLTPNS